MFKASVQILAVMLACLLPVVSRAAEAVEAVEAVEAAESGAASDTAPSRAPESEKAGRFGIALNTSTNGEVYPMRLVPTATFVTGRSALEAGVGFHPFIRKDQRILSGEFNYKYFPNGMDQTLSVYVIARLSYVNNALETFYPTTYHYLFLNAGYGVILCNNTKTYLGTNVTAGPFTYARSSENPYEGFEKDGLFDKVGVNLAFQFNVGYRF